jgi:CelD/BcsL family acetyltransferase involved in cellulose biosynthesis
MQMPLPASWDDYLGTLDGKQRHEARRKLRRAADAGELEISIIRDAADTGRAMDVFLRLFRQSRPDKAAFMTPRREAFFRRLADELARAGMLNLTCINIDRRPAAAVFCVDFDQTRFLYNNGFDPQYRGISIGVVSKLMTIRGGIDDGRQTYDFLNGGERYKHRLGGTEVPLSTCVVEL